jgi:hypothetical protein
MPAHPEQAADEVFVGNHHGDMVPQELSHIPSMRLGSIAYDIDGKRLPESYGYRPLLVGRGADHDRYDRIREAAFRAIRG